MDSNLASPGLASALILPLALQAFSFWHLISRLGQPSMAWAAKPSLGGQAVSWPLEPMDHGVPKCRRKAIYNISQKPRLWILKIKRLKYKPRKPNILSSTDKKG
jgi:hypothetical protein